MKWYTEVTGRRVSVEYAFISDVNDQAWGTHMLDKRLHQLLWLLAYVNLISFTPTLGSYWDASPKVVERKFVRRVCLHRLYLYRARYLGSGDQRGVWSAGRRAVVDPSCCCCHVSRRMRE